jgi:hypothetical protein
MTPIEVEVPAEAFTAAIRATIVCPKHLAVRLVDICCDSPRTHWWPEHEPADFKEFVGYQPSTSERQPVHELGLTVGVAPAAEGEPGHFRYRLKCSRPSCNYSWEGTDRWLSSFVAEVLDALLLRGDTYTIVAEKQGVMKELDL